MGIRNLTPAMRTWRGEAPVAAGVDGAVVTWTEVDTQGYEALRAIIVLGAIAAGGIITVDAKNSDTSVTYGAGTIDNIVTGLTAVKAPDDSSKVMIIEIYRPKRRYVRFQYRRTVGNVTIDSVVYELFNPVHKQVLQASADVAQLGYGVYNSPAPSLV